MAKMFYTAEEAAELLGKTEDDLTKLVRDGKLREFRDAGKKSYKVEDIDSLQGLSASGSGAGASASGEIVLEPIDDSSIELPDLGSDILSLEDLDAGDTASSTGTAAAQKAKGDTVVPSVGVNVFDDDELDEHVDPLAQTAITDVAGLGVEGAGSGSGILDLTRESDDTSLGAELLEEIYSGEDDNALEMGDKTRAGLDDAIPEAEIEDEDEPTADEDEVAAAETETGAKISEDTSGGRKKVVREVVEYGLDPITSGLTALMGVSVLVLLFGGLSAAAMVRGVMPSVVDSVYSNLWMFAAGAAGTAILAAAVAFFMAKRSR